PIRLDSACKPPILSDVTPLRVGLCRNQFFGNTNWLYHQLVKRPGFWGVAYAGPLPAAEVAMRESIRAAASPLRVAPPLHKTFTAAYRQAATESASGAAYRRRGMFAIRPRRALLVVSAAALLTFRPSAYAADVPLTQFVNPFIGTQGAPNTLEGG